MSRVGINTGNNPNDGQGDSLREAMGKINNNFIEIYNTFGNGTDIESYSNISGVSTTSENLTGNPIVNVSGILNTGITTTEHIEVRNITSSGVVPAISFIGDGSQLENVTATNTGVEVLDDSVRIGVARELNFGEGVSVGSPDGVGRVLVSLEPNSRAGYFDNNQTNPGIHTTASHVGLGTTNPITSIQVNDVYGIETGSGSFTASAGVAYTANTYTSSDFVTSEYTLFFQHSSGIQSQKILVMDNDSTAYSQEYAVMYSGDLLVSVGATVKSGNVELWWTPETGVNGTVTYKFTRETML